MENVFLNGNSELQGNTFGLERFQKAQSLPENQVLKISISLEKESKFIKKAGAFSVDILHLFISQQKKVIGQ